MKVYENDLYKEDVEYVSNLSLPWEKLKGKSLLISGATGSIGSFLIDVLMYRNSKYNMRCKVYAIGRNEEKMRKRFAYCTSSGYLFFLKWNINQEIDDNEIGTIDYLIHLASNTHPILYANEPIDTILTNVIGTKNLLDFSVNHGVSRVLFASSNEIYGVNRGDVEKFTEDYCGYIDCNTLRAGYTESKRCGEALCQAYIQEKNKDIVVARFTRTYGPTLLPTDTKALSQFINKAVKGQDIVLKSEGNQYFSYLYVADSVSGLLYILFKGKTGEAYNVSDEKSDIILRDLASLIAEIKNKSVIYEIPDAVENSGYSKATKARLDNGKITNLGWTAKYNIKSGVYRTIKIFDEIDWI